MEINILIDEGFEGYIDEAWLESLAREVLAAEGIESSPEISLVITGQERIRGLNSTYLGRDEPTDVISFSMLPEYSGTDQASFVSPPDGIKHLGEVIISYPQAVIQAEERKHTVKRELAILLIHGVLHLLGYDHEELEMEQKMRAREAVILSRIERGQG
jgi:probable rRNA maturation factor